MRFTPRLEFVYDPSIDYSVRVEQTLQDIKNGPPDAAQGPVEEG
jgi:ribosome-binding factor A